MLSNSLIALLEKKRSSLSKIENEILIYLSQLLLSPERLNI